MTASPSVRIAIILFASRPRATRRTSASARCFCKAAKAVSASAVSACGGGRRCHRPRPASNQQRAHQRRGRADWTGKNQPLLRNVIAGAKRILLRLGLEVHRTTPIEHFDWQSAFDGTSGTAAHQAAPPNPLREFFDSRKQGPVFGNGIITSIFMTVTSVDFVDRKFVSSKSGFIAAEV